MVIEGLIFSNYQQVARIFGVESIYLCGSYAR